MGLTYKALKYRDIKMNMTKAKVNDVGATSNGDEMLQEQQVSAIANEANRSQVYETTTTLADKQEHFTADHIMQLCLFLAEKSRAKQLQQNQEMNARKYYENFLKEANDFVEDEQMHSDSESTLPQAQTQSTCYKLKSPQIKPMNSSVTQQTSPRAARRIKTKPEKFLKQTILTDKFSTSNCNLLPVTYEKLTPDEQRHQQSLLQQHQQQDKRDILLKIRQQIFERKRLKQMLSGDQQQNSQYPQPQRHQQPVQRFVCNSAEMQAQEELRQLSDVWRPW